MSRICPEFLDPAHSDVPVVRGVFVRQEPDEENEEEDEDDRKDDRDDDDEEDEGYSE
jgi:hypothetical protein